MRKIILILAVFSLMTALSMPVMSQGTGDHLQPCDIILPKFEAVYTGNILEDPEGFRNHLESMRNNPRTYDTKCWSPGGGNNAALVAIVKAFYNAIGYKDTERISSKLEDIKNLTGKYASQLQDPYREYYLLRIDKKPANWVFDF